MRKTFLVALFAVFTTGLIGCVGGDGASLNGGPRLRKGNVAAGAHDPDDLGEDDAAEDPGNPNADTQPGAPATSGIAAAEFTVTLDNATPSLGLGADVELTATVEPKNGFTGPVQLQVTGLPPGVTTDAATVNVAGTTTAKLVLRTSLDAVVTDSAPLVVKATSGGVEATANANVKIAPKVTVTIPMNVDALRGASQLRSQYGGDVFAGQGSFKTQPGNGIVVSVFNADSKSHIIHGPGGSFPHGNESIAPNSFEGRTRTLDVGANVTAYLHDGDQGQGASFQIKVDAAD